MHTDRRAMGRQGQARGTPDASRSAGDHGRAARQVQVDKIRIVVHGRSRICGSFGWADSTSPKAKRRKQHKRLLDMSVLV
jgi:hypothetical protein